MQVRMARKRGFCFGVQDAVKRCEQALAAEGRHVAVLGPIIHNRQVVDRLAEAGLQVVDDLDALAPGTTLLIRAHGVPPELLDRARRRGLKILDATCTLVKRAQGIVRQLHEEGYHVVVIGDRNHPEVKGVVGYAPKVTVVDREDELDEALPPGGRLGIVAQTTHAPEHVARMIGAIAARGFREIKIINTLCLEVIRRQQAALELCQQVDVMFVLGGLHSANTKELARLCRQTGVDTYHLESWEQFRSEMVAGKTVAGVTAGTSTPEWIIETFASNLQAVEPPPAG